MSSTANEQDIVFDAAVETAYRQIAESGTFIPFGCSLDAEGKARLHMCEVVHESDEAEQYVALLRETFADECREGVLRAVAVATPARVESPESGGPYDAIRIEIDHVDADKGIACLVPYTPATDGAIELGDPITGHVDDRILGYLS